MVISYKTDADTENFVFLRKFLKTSIVNTFSI